MHITRIEQRLMELESRPMDRDDLLELILILRALVDRIKRLEARV